MSAGTMNSVGGQLLAQGYAGMGDSLAQGIQQYAQNKRLDATTTGQIEALMQNGIQQGTAKNWSPQTQKLAQKLSQGSANLNDKMTLLGSLQTDQAMQTQNLQRQAAQQEIAIRQRQSDTINYIMNLAQQQTPGAIPVPQGPAGSAPQGAPGQGAAQPQAPIISNPYGYTQDPDVDTRNFLIKTVRSTGQLPQPSEVNANTNQRNKWLDTEQNIGFVGASEYDDDGNLKDRKIFPATIKPGQPRSINIGKDGIPIGPLGQPTMPLIDPATGQRIDPAKAFGPNFNPNAKGAQEDLQNAYSSLNKANDSLSNAQFFQGAVKAYAQDPTSGSRLNAILGNEKAAKLRQFFTGKNPVDQIQAAQGRMYADTIDSLRNDKTGANGIRAITQQELGNLQAQYGQPDMTPAQQQVLADNAAAVMQRHRDMIQGYVNLRSNGMRPSDADQAVLSSPQFSKPLTLGVNNPNDPTKNLTKGTVYRNAKGQRALWDGSQWVAAP